VWLDLDDSVIQTSGYAKQAAGRGYTGVKGLNALVATASTPLGGAGDRRNAATSGERPLVRGAATLVRGAAGRPPLWSLWTGYSSHRFGVLYPRRGHRGPRGRSPIQCHHPALPIGDQGSRRHRRHPDSLAPIAYATSIRDTPRQKALLAAATGSNGDQLRVPLTKFEVRCATHLVHRRNVPRPQ
jgi:hypothetical protein